MIGMGETRTCAITGKPFETTDEDLAFYEKMKVPPPTLCPEERERRRIVWRNERHLYPAKCGLCEKNLITMYPEESPFPIYCQGCFWSDEWDPLEYGQDFDFSRPFFPQFKELLDKVPQLSVFQAHSTNSEYTANSFYNKNCYLTSGADHNEDCLYGINTQRSKFCSDHYLIYDSELCYGCLDSSRLYHCVGCQECEQCRDSWFLYDCKGCRNCAFSRNLRNQEYMIFNKKLSKEDYEKRLEEILNTLFEDPDWMDTSRRKIRKGAIQRHALILNSERSLGNNIRNCKNAQHVFDVEDLEDCKFINYGLGMKDSYDVSAGGWESALLYEMISDAEAYHTAFCSSVITGRDLQYSRCVWNAKNCFGSISLQGRHRFVILNKQYEENEYQNLRTRIVEHMKTTREYGEFFPPALSPFEYNRSMPIDYMPLSREEALKRGFRWYEGGKKARQNATYAIPNRIDDVPDSVVDEVLKCAECDKNYRVIAQEVKLHHQMKVPLPKFCWPCRLQKLIQSRLPRALFKNTCKKCSAPIETPYAPDRPEMIYCESCYLSEVY